MTYDFTHLFSQAQEPETPAFLHEHIMQGVSRARIRAARIAFGAYSAAAFILGITLVPAFGYVMQAVVRSGFLQYASLIFSDGMTVTSLWKDFIVLLTETFPFIHAAGFLTLVFLCLVSLRFAARAAGQMHFVFRPYSFVRN